MQQCGSESPVSRWVQPPAPGAGWGAALQPGKAPGPWLLQSRRNQRGRKRYSRGGGEGEGREPCFKGAIDVSTRTVCSSAQLLTSAEGKRVAARGRAEAVSFPQL